MTLMLIIAMLAVLLGNALLAVFCIRKTNAGKASVIRRTAILTAVSLILLYALYFILCRFTLRNALTVPIFSLAFTEILVSAAILPPWNREKRPQRFFCNAVKLICLSLALELAVFCGNCYAMHPKAEVRAFTEEETELPQSNARFDGTDIVISGPTELVFPIHRQNVRYVQFFLESDDSFYQAECSMTDENFSIMMQKISQTWMNASQNTLTFAVAPYGTLHELKVNFWNVNGVDAVRLHGMTLLNVKPYSFSLLRFLLLAGVLCLIAAIRIFEWHKISYDRRNVVHCEILTAAMILCVAGVFWIAPPAGMGIVEYSKDGGVSDYDPYAQTFDAWQHGQLHLNLEVDPKLAELENPYDRMARDAAGAVTQWDRAFYDGKYYSYFGITPVLLVYYPIYFVTGMLPTPALATVIFSAAAIVFLYLLVLTMLRRYKRRVNLLLLLLGMFAAAAASGLFFCANYADRYYTAISAGICFLYLFLWLGYEADMAKQQRSRCMLLAGCGIAVAFTVLSRPPMALYVVLLLPLFLPSLRRRDLSRSQKAAAAASFAVPLAIGAAVTMAYNAARFSSPFDFGTAYQLTVSNTAANHVTPTAFPAAMAYYFLNLPTLDGAFPFLQQSMPAFADPKQYVYLTYGFGVFVFPMIPAAFLLLPSVTGKRLCRQELRHTFRLAFALTVLMAFLDYCMGGYNSRYLCDILPILAVFSLLVLLIAQRNLRSIPMVYTTFSRVTAAAFLLTPVLLLALLLSCADHFSIWNTQPEFYFKLRDFIVFWR